MTLNESKERNISVYVDSDMGIMVFCISLFVIYEHSHKSIESSANFYIKTIKTNSVQILAILLYKTLRKAKALLSVLGL